MLYWARLEAFYRDIPDLLDVPARKFCNLLVHWMMEHVDGEVWDREYKSVFFPDPDAPQHQPVVKAKLADAKPGVEGSLNIKVPEEKVKVTMADLDGFFGRAGSSGKSDPNKAVLRAKAEQRKASITIGPDADGNLSVDTPENG